MTAKKAGGWSVSSAIPPLRRAGAGRKADPEVTAVIDKARKVAPKWLTREYDTERQARRAIRRIRYQLPAALRVKTRVNPIDGSERVTLAIKVEAR